MRDPLSTTMEQWVVLMVLVVFSATVIFFFLTLVMRIKRLREDEKKKKYQATVENILFKYLFETPGLEDIQEIFPFQQMQKDMLFKRVAIKAIISLHDNYSGTYSKKLEDFFIASGLVDYSIAKLESNRWEYVVEGVRDLSTLNHQASYSRIASRIIHPHTLVRTEVLLALIKMRGIEEIMKFQKTGLMLSDWTQSNILYTVKKHKIPAPADFKIMLESPNSTLVLLAVRLIDYFKKAEYYEILSTFFMKSKDEKLKLEIAKVLRKTEYIS